MLKYLYYNLLSVKIKVKTVMGKHFAEVNPLLIALVLEKGI